MGIEELEDLEEIETLLGVWIVKDLTNYAVVGFRHDSKLAAQFTLDKAQKEYPDHKFEIRKIR